jgi:hypothetical protein
MSPLPSVLVIGCGRIGERRRRTCPATFGMISVVVATPAPRRFAITTEILRRLTLPQRDVYKCYILFYILFI